MAPVGGGLPGSGEHLRESPDDRDRKGLARLRQWIGRINSRILLTLIFFLFLTPIAWLYRLFNRTLVDHFLADTRASTFQERNHRWEPADFEKIW